MSSKKNKDYWRGRFAQFQDEILKPSDNYIKDLDSIYDQAFNNIHNDLNKWYLRFMDNNGIVDYQQAQHILNKKELKELRWNVRNYIKYGQENALNEKWVHQLKNASARVHIKRLEGLEIQMKQYIEELYAKQEQKARSLLSNIYQESYYKISYETAKYFKDLTSSTENLFIKAIDKRKIEKIISKPWSVSGKNFSDNIWANKDLLINNLHKHLSVGLLNGENPDKIIRNFKKSMNSSNFNARRLIMTESAYFSMLGQEECYGDLGVKKVEIIGTLDKTTCSKCSSFDKKVIELKNFEAGVTVPPFHPHCRCTTIPYFNDEFTQNQTRITRDENGNTIYIDTNMSYNDWKRNYIEKLDISDSIDNNYSNKSNFDLDKTLQEIKELTKNAPIGLRFCLENQLNTNNFLIDKNWNLPFGYDVKTEKIIINPYNNKFCYYNIKKALTHELAHKIDLEAIQSYADINFMKSIKNETYKINTNIGYYKNLITNTPLRNNMAISDIFSALSQNKIKGDFFHSDVYWNDFINVNLEIFANLFQIICINDIVEIDILNKELQGLKDAFLKLFI